MRIRHFFLFLLSAALSPLLCQCTILPKAEDKPVTAAISSPSKGPLAAASNKAARNRPKAHSSFLLLENNKAALDWRLALIDSAQSSLDIQLYLWQSSASSRLLFNRVIQAADRGVRVRILVDEFLFSTDEKKIAAICRYHPNIDIRIFNINRFRGNSLSKLTGFALNFSELNRRMHNKTWTADQLFTIVGGRNVHDHYFGLDENYNFLDLDVLATGPVVSQVGKGFDLFWNDSKSYPGALLSSRAKPEHIEEIKTELSEVLAGDQSTILKSFPIQPQNWSKKLGSLNSQMTTGLAEFIQDHPDPEKDEREVVSSLRRVLQQKTTEVILISPYFIPSKGAIEQLRITTDSGIKVGILAPSLASNNQALAHSHYKKKRKGLLENGARLFELKAEPSQFSRQLADTDPVRSKIVSLHSKAIVGDRSLSFIGSLNLDPRAMVINTECGLLIKSPEFSNHLLTTIRKMIEANDVWEVKKDQNGKLIWTNTDGQALNTRPPAPFSKKILSFIGGLLPIENQL
ncbi:MAG: phospholipase D family protein [Akkermansiaceae bacterium]